MMTPRPKRWSITKGGTLPRRNPGMFTDLATSAYALSILGLRSANGTSTVILTRVGLNCSTVLGTLLTPVFHVVGAAQLPDLARLSPGNPKGSRTSDQPAAARRADQGGWSERPMPPTLDQRASEPRTCGA